MCLIVSQLVSTSQWSSMSLTSSWYRALLTSKSCTARQRVSHSFSVNIADFRKLLLLPSIPRCFLTSLTASRQVSHLLTSKSCTVLLPSKFHTSQIILQLSGNSHCSRCFLINFRKSPSCFQLSSTHSLKIQLMV